MNPTIVDSPIVLATMKMIQARVAHGIPTSSFATTMAVIRKKYAAVCASMTSKIL